MTIWKWIIKYSKLAKEFVDSLKLENISGDWHVDETTIRCDGEFKWFWQVIDKETKFLIATHLSRERTIEEVLKLFRQARKRVIKRPNKIVVDGLWLMKEHSRKFSITDTKNIELNS